jgi:regulator of replication initiation timing
MAIPDVVVQQYKQLEELVKQLRTENAALRVENAKLRRSLDSILDSGPDGIASCRTVTRDDYEDALPWHEDDRS